MAIISLTRIKTFIHSIRWKITIAYLLIIVVAFCVIGFSLIQLVGEYLFNQRTRDDQRIAESLSEAFGGLLSSSDVLGMYDAALQTARAEQSRVLVLDRLCTVQVDTHSQLNGQRVITVRDMQLNVNNRSVTVSGREVNLTAKEFDLLHLFVTNRGKVFSRENLLETIWKYDYLGDLRTVDVHIRRLREKIEKVPSQPEYIFTKWGVGYYFTDKD